jgi:hypothetical protein
MASYGRQAGWECGKGGEATAALKGSGPYVRQAGGECGKCGEATAALERIVSYTGQAGRDSNRHKLGAAIEGIISDGRGACFDHGVR